MSAATSRPAERSRRSRAVRPRPGCRDSRWARAARCGSRSRCRRSISSACCHRDRAAASRYPYDLEWMEGGMLHHALRIHDGARHLRRRRRSTSSRTSTRRSTRRCSRLFGGVFGLTYTLGRVISVLVAARHLRRRRARRSARARVTSTPRCGPALVGVALALGLFAAAYPVRRGLVRPRARRHAVPVPGHRRASPALPRWATTGDRARAVTRASPPAAALLAFAFFCEADRHHLRRARRRDRARRCVAPAPDVHRGRPALIGLGGTRAPAARRRTAGSGPTSARSTARTTSTWIGSGSRSATSCGTSAR